MKIVIASEAFSVPDAILKAFLPVVLVLSGGEYYRAVKITNCGAPDKDGVYRRPQYSFTTLPTCPDCFAPRRNTAKWTIAFWFRLDAGYMSDSVEVARRVSSKWVLKK